MADPDPSNPEHRALTERAVGDMPCPRCQNRSLRIEWTLKARPIGSFSLAGAGMKFSATEIPVIICSECGLRAEGGPA